MRIIREGGGGDLNFSQEEEVLSLAHPTALKILQLIAKIFFTMWINPPLFRIPTEAKAEAEMLPSPSWLHTESQKGYGLLAEENSRQIRWQIYQICQASYWYQHLYCPRKQTQLQKVVR